MMVLAAWGLVLALTSCAPGGNQTQEPVGDDGAPAQIPDTPGEGGETAEKPAGAGQAGDAAPETATVGKAAAAAPGELTVATNGLNVRSGPGMTHPVVRVLKQGERIKPVSCELGWCKLGDGEFVGRKNLQ